MGLVLHLLFSCTSDSAETLYPTNDLEAEAFYESTLKTVIDSKCISCHVYHLTGDSRYDSFVKTKDNIEEMVSRINSETNLVMPPSGQEQLTDEEKMLFQEFLDILTSEVQSEEEVSGTQLTWTAFKYPDRFTNNRDGAGVEGTFDEIEYSLNENYSEPIDILDGAEVVVTTSSVNIDGVTGPRTSNVGTYFFPFFTSLIRAEVISYDENSALITITMNEKESEVMFDLVVEETKLVLQGTIEDLNLFDWQTAHDELQIVCGEFHENKLWPDVSLKVEIPFEVEEP